MNRMHYSSLHRAQSHPILRSWQCQRNDINHHADFVLPMFIGNKEDAIESIESMPDVNRYGCNAAVKYLEPLVYSFGLRAVLLFPVVTKNTDEIPVDDGDATEKPKTESVASSSDESQTTSGDASDDDSDIFEDDERVMVTHKRKPTNKQAGTATSSIVPNKSTRDQDVQLIKGLALRDENNPVLRLIPMLREKFPNLLIICDVCLCAFTSTGHCCIFDNISSCQNARISDNYSIKTNSNIEPTHYPISNKITCQYLAKLAIEYALRGCDVLAPSDMMDGRIQVIREKLNENHLHHVSIMSYSAKFASSFYGPFRQAAASKPQFGDRKAYQLPPGSRALALKAVSRDIDQGADIVMVKPGTPYLDIVRDIRESHPNVPIAVYQVSGEYSMLKLAADANILDLKSAVHELLASYRRAGASIIITYFAPAILRGELQVLVA